jgi:hypothetical protein
MTNVRYQLKQDIVMHLDGQVQIALSGTVFDDLPTTNYAAAHVTVLSPTEPAGTVNNSRPTSVRNVRTK